MMIRVLVWIRIFHFTSKHILIQQALRHKIKRYFVPVHVSFFFRTSILKTG
jgi:hypothetical protein